MKNQYMVIIVAHPLTVKLKNKPFPFILQLSLLFRHLVKEAVMDIGLL